MSEHTQAVGCLATAACSVVRLAAALQGCQSDCQSGGDAEGRRAEEHGQPCLLLKGPAKGSGVLQPSPPTQPHLPHAAHQQVPAARCCDCSFVKVEAVSGYSPPNHHQYERYVWMGCLCSRPWTSILVRNGMFRRPAGMQAKSTESDAAICSRHRRLQLWIAVTVF